MWFWPLHVYIVYIPLKRYIHAIHILYNNNDDCTIFTDVKNKWDLKTISEFAAILELLQIDLKDEHDRRLNNDIQLFLKIYEV